jgi:hypothetical protein
MPEQWIIRVEEKEYGPATLEMLREWKGEGRVLPGNQVRRTDAELWMTAADIPGLFESQSPPVQTIPPPNEPLPPSEPLQPSQPLPPSQPLRPGRSLAKIIAETFRILRKGLFQYFSLTLLIILPSVCAQLTTAGLDASPGVDVDLRKLLAGGFALCMMLLLLAFWPIYISGIQILTAELNAGRRPGFFPLLNEAVKSWPRVALLCVFVYGSYIFWTVLPVVIILAVALSGPSWISFFIGLLALAFQVWIIGKLFINFMFWQQFAVLEGADAGTALRQSKELARGRRDLPWYQRPKWRGVFLASLWFAVVLAINVPPVWPMLSDYFHRLATAQDPQALVQEMAARSRAAGFDVVAFALGLLQTILRPLLGISFVLLYLDAKEGFRDEGEN